MEKRQKDESIYFEHSFIHFFNILIVCKGHDYQDVPRCQIEDIDG